MFDPTIPASSNPPSAPAQRLRDAASLLETTFVAEMLRAAGLGAPAGDFGGGTGEAQFSSFLIDAQAREIVRAGGVGLAEALVSAMSDRRNDR